MTDFAIRVRRVSKVYTIWRQPRARLTGALARRIARISFLPRPLRDGMEAYRKRVGTEFAALSEIDFDVRRGETVGIIGRNGSGKSTILKIIAGVLDPTGGQVEVKGRVAALLELGTGFNPEFTGRENVQLNASILGLSRTELAEKFEEIAAFADIGPFLEQPVKTYSSGMMVRLAFAVHTALDPEILIIDEALSVGDQAFRRKCFARLERMREAGTTILFVSHDLGSVLHLTQHALLFNRGRIVLRGHPKQVAQVYEQASNAPAGEEERVLENALRRLAEGAEAAGAGEGAASPVRLPPEAAGFDFDPALRVQSTRSYDSHGAEIHDVSVISLDGRTVNLLKRGERYIYRYRVRFSADCVDVSFAMLVKTLKGVELGGARSLPLGKFYPLMKAGTVYEVRFSFLCALTPGAYFLNAGAEGALAGKRAYVHRLVDAAVFRVVPELAPLPTGTVDFAVEPSVEVLEEAVAR